MAKVKAKSKTSASRKPAAKSTAKKAKVGAKKMKVATTSKHKIDLTHIKPIAEKQTKSQLIQFIAEQTGLTRSNVTDTFKVLSLCIQGQMRKKGFGEISIPETGIKVRRLRKPATKSRTMISPFSGQEITVKAKPARNVVKVTALKSLKESVNN